MYYIIRVNGRLQIAEIVDKSASLTKAKLKLDKHRQLIDNSSYYISKHKIDCWKTYKTLKGEI